MQYFIAYNISAQLYKRHFSALVLFIIAHIVFLLHSQYVFQLTYFSIISRSGSSRAILSPSANAGDHHSILSISIFVRYYFHLYLYFEATNSRPKPLYNHPELLLCIYKVIWCIFPIGSWPADRYQLYALISNCLIQFPF